MVSTRLKLFAQLNWARGPLERRVWESLAGSSNNPTPSTSPIPALRCQKSMELEVMGERLPIECMDVPFVAMQSRQVTARSIRDGLRLAHNTFVSSRSNTFPPLAKSPGPKAKTSNNSTLTGRQGDNGEAEKGAAGLQATKLDQLTKEQLSEVVMEVKRYVKQKKNNGKEELLERKRGYVEENHAQHRQSKAQQYLVMEKRISGIRQQAAQERSRNAAVRNSVRERELRARRSQERQAAKEKRARIAQGRHCIAQMIAYAKHMNTHSQAGQKEQLKAARKSRCQHARENREQGLRAIHNVLREQASSALQRKVEDRTAIAEDLMKVREYEKEKVYNAGSSFNLVYVDDVTLTTATIEEPKQTWLDSFRLRKRQSGDGL